MMHPNHNNDLEKDVSVSEGSSETEGSHTHGAEVEEDGFPVVVQGKDVKIVSPKPKHPHLYCLGIAAVLGLVVVLPSVLVDRHKDSTMGSASANLEPAVGLDLEEDELETTTTTTSTPVDYDTFEYTPLDNEQCPGHLEEGEYSVVSRIWALELSLGQRATNAGERTFEVEPSHTVLENDSGVVFNVETVPEPLPEDLAKPLWTQQEITQRVQDEASEFYQNATAAMSYPVPPLPDVSIEVMSAHHDVPLVYAGNQGFLAACMMSFAQHLPLALTPDDIWTIIAQGFARHIDQHAEELRHNFVAHDGKAQIRIREDSMVRGSSPPEQWEELIFPKFSQEIGHHMMNNQEAYQTLSQLGFSTSTPTSQAASEITLMSTLKNFFEYTMVTACGIPKVRLEGTRQDWVLLRQRTAQLAQWMLPNDTHGELWITDIVLPILDQFVQAYDGHVNYCFWQTMVKFRNTGGGSGSYDFLSGWLPTLFPYLSMGEGVTQPNPHLRTWQESASALHEGPQPNQIPHQMSSVPVLWEYFGDEIPLHFHAGFRGVTQEADGTLKPVLGWIVTNDPTPDKQ